jgi:hypothetical protein
MLLQETPLSLVGGGVSFVRPAGHTHLEVQVFCRTVSGNCYTSCPKESSVSPGNSSVRHPRESGDPEEARTTKKEKTSAEMGIKNTTPRFWVPAFVGMTGKGLSQRKKRFADAFWQSLYELKSRLQKKGQDHGIYRIPQWGKQIL